MDLQLADILIFALYAITTVLLVVWSRRSAGAARRSARAAEQSAQAASRSADAAERSALAAEAQTQLQKQSLDAQIVQGRRESMQRQPLLVQSGGSGKAGVHHTIPIANRGEPVRDVRLLSVRGQLKLEIAPPHFLEKGSSFNVYIKTPGTGWFEIGFTNSYQEEGSVWFYSDGKSKIIAHEVGQPPIPDSELAEWLARRGA